MSWNDWLVHDSMRSTDCFVLSLSLFLCVRSLLWYLLFLFYFSRFSRSFARSNERMLALCLISLGFYTFCRGRALSLSHTHTHERRQSPRTKQQIELFIFIYIIIYFYFVWFISSLRLPWRDPLDGWIVALRALRTHVINRSHFLLCKLCAIHSVMKHSRHIMLTMGYARFFNFVLLHFRSSTHIAFHSLSVFSNILVQTEKQLQQPNMRRFTRLSLWIAHVNAITVHGRVSMDFSEYSCWCSWCVCRDWKSERARERSYASINNDNNSNNKLLS